MQIGSYFFFFRLSRHPKSVGWRVYKINAEQRQGEVIYSPNFNNGGMHTLIHVDRTDYVQAVESILRVADRDSQNACFISFNSPYNVVVNFLGGLDNLDAEKFVVIDASNTLNNRKKIDHKTYTLPFNDLFKVYLFLREVIQNNQVDFALVDSISALIHKFSDFPLKRMMSDLLLEMGTQKCKTSLMVFKEHSNHDIVKSIAPLVGHNISLTGNGY